MGEHTHLFVVAIETYQDASIPPVKFAEADGRDFVDAWRQLVPEQPEVVHLESAKATKTTIMSRLKTFCDHVQKSDRVVVFFAGHGVSINSSSCITAHDTLHADLTGTTIRLNDLLDLLKKCASQRVLLFLDSCSSGVPIDANMRSITSSFSGEELKAFCKDAEYRVGFASCRAEEVSYSHSSVGHGLWTYLILRALRGEANEAFEKDALITGSSLQSYLAANLPPLVRNTVTGKKSQTACFFGNHTKEFIVADLKDLLQQKATVAGISVAMADSRIVGLRNGKIKMLSGFLKKSHFVPDTCNPATDKFVKSVGSANVDELGKEIFEQLKKEFRYKSKEVNYSADSGECSITGPDFSVGVSISQDNDPSKYVIEIEVTDFHKPEAVMTEAFANVFEDYCDRIVIELAHGVDCESRIQQLEEIPSYRDNLHYDADRTWFSLELPDTNLVVRCQGNEISIQHSEGGDLPALLRDTRDALQGLDAAGIKLLPGTSR